ncbi:MAG: DUF4190 domain-containing protein [Pirellulales bacterium]|nr:DUF4190 domain-containing protein [Pirellulales bacterium]
MTGEQPSPTPGRQRRYRGRAFEERLLGDGQMYRAINRFAVLSVVLGALSWLTAVSWAMVFLPIAGLLLGYLALYQIRWATGEMTGRGVAIAGMILSGAFWLVGSGYAVFCAVSEVPIGYTRLEFKDMQPDPANEGEIIPKEMWDLEEKYIYLKGFMYPGRQAMDIQKFVLVPTLGHCKFCQRELKSTEMVEVRLQGDLLIDYSIHPVGVGGKLVIDRKEAVKPLGGMPYVIEADYVFK